MKFILQKVNLPVIVEKKVIKFEFAAKAQWREGLKKYLALKITWIWFENF